MPKLPVARSIVIIVLLVLATACSQVVPGPQNSLPAVTTAAVVTPLPVVATAPLPTAMSLPTATSRPPITKLTTPPDISCFLSDVTSRVDRTGAIFWNSQCRNNRGQLVFRTDAAGTTVALVTGQGGRGSLDVGPDGRLYITVTDLEQIHAFHLPVPGWQP